VVIEGKRSKSRGHSFERTKNDNMRIGFEFIDLSTDDKSVLASLTGRGPKVGKYFVNLEGCRFAAERLKDAVKNSDIIICDEIGLMELKSKQFIDSVKNLLNVDKVIVVVHQKLVHAVSDEFRYKCSLLIEMNLQNREKISEIFLSKCSE
jgi:nucleoside-triphosphatase